MNSTLPSPMVADEAVACCRRASERRPWRQRPRMSFFQDIGDGLLLGNTTSKGRIAGTSSFIKANDVVLEEAPVPLALFIPGYCFGCAASLTVPGVPPRSDGFVPVKPGCVQCTKCRRYFCSRRCSSGLQHEHECSLMQAIDAGLNPGAGSWVGDTPVPTQLYVRMHCEAVARGDATHATMRRRHSTLHSSRRATRPLPSASTRRNSDVRLHTLRMLWARTARRFGTHTEC